MPVAINPKAMLATLEQRPAGTTNKRHRTVLAVVREHARLEAEPVWDLDRLMATLVPEPAYGVSVEGQPGFRRRLCGRTVEVGLTVMEDTHERADEPETWMPR